MKDYTKTQLWNRTLAVQPGNLIHDLGMGEVAYNNGHDIKRQLQNPAEMLKKLPERKIFMKK